MADKVIISKSKLVALGDAIREKIDSSEKMTVDVMTEAMRNYSGGQEEIIECLTADYAQEELPIWKGTTIPNSGTITNVYFNTYLSIEEVEELVSKLDLVELTAWGITSKMYFVASDSNFENYVYIDVSTSGRIGLVYLNSDGFNEVFDNTYGWYEAYQTLNFNIDFNVNLSPTTYYDRTLVNVGLQNELLKNLFSSKPFEAKLDGFCSNVANAIRTRKKTTNLINAQNFDDEILSIEDNAKVIEFPVKDKDIETGVSGDVYLDLNAFTPEELNTLLLKVCAEHKTDMENHRAEMISLFKTNTNKHIIIYNVYYGNPMLCWLDDNKGMGKTFFEEGQFKTVDGYGDLGECYSNPILTEVETIIESNNEGYNRIYAVDCPEITNKLFYIGKKDIKVEAKLDITSEELDRLNEVEVVTPTETKIFSDSTGGTGSNASVVNKITNLGPIRGYNSGDVYINPDKYSKDEINEKISYIFSVKPSYSLSKGRYRLFGTSSGMEMYLEKLQNTDTNAIAMYTYDSGTVITVLWDGENGWNVECLNKALNSNTVEIRSAVTEIETSLDGLFIFGKIESSLQINLDITSEQINLVDKFELITPTQTRIVSDFKLVDTELNNPNIKNIYYYMPVQMYTKVFIDLPKFAEVLAKLNGYNGAEEWLNEVPSSDNYDRSRYFKLFYMKGFSFSANSSHNISNNDSEYAYCELHFHDGNTNGSVYTYGSLSRGNFDYQYFPHEDGLTEYQYLQKIGEIEINISGLTRYFDEIDEGLILFLTQIAVDDNNNYLDLNTVEVVDWIRFE